MAWILVVHESDEVAELCGRAVKDALSTNALVLIASNLSRARYFLADNPVPMLVVLGGEVPDSSTSRHRRGDGAAARQFASWFGMRAPLVVLSATSDPEMARLIDPARGALIPFDTQWRTALTHRVRELVDGAPPADRAVLELEIVLPGLKGGIWRLERKGRVHCSEMGQMHIDFDFLDVLTRHAAMRGEDRVARARTLWPQYAHLLDALPNPGTDLLSYNAAALKSVLFGLSPDNQRLWKRFSEERDVVGGTENVRVFFTMGTNIHHVAVEALADLLGESTPDAPAWDYWMLKAPIVRQYTSSGPTPMLFKGRASSQGLRCLVVRADSEAGDILDGPWKGRYGPLPNSVLEAQRVETILKTAAAAFGIEKVHSLHLGAGGDPLNELLDALKDGPWHLVHFVGHGAVSSEGDGGLVLSAKAGVVEPFSGLAPRLLGTQFLFISSCESANVAFLWDAIRGAVPALLGYRWPVQDSGALGFAEAFYGALLCADASARSFKSLEYASVKARQESQAASADFRTWASPLLLTQLRRSDDATPFH